MHRSIRRTLARTLPVLLTLGCAVSNPSRQGATDTRVGQQALLRSAVPAQRMALSRTHSPVYRERHRAPVTSSRRSPRGRASDPIVAGAGWGQMLAAILNSVAGSR